MLGLPKVRVDGKRPREKGSYFLVCLDQTALKGREAETVIPSSQRQSLIKQIFLPAWIP